MVPRRNRRARVRIVTRLIPDERPVIESTLESNRDENAATWCDHGGTGPAPRESRRKRARPSPTGNAWFGEQMRQVSLKFVRPRSCRGRSP